MCSIYLTLSPTILSPVPYNHMPLFNSYSTLFHDLGKSITGFYSYPLSLTQQKCIYSSTDAKWKGSCSISHLFTSFHLRCLFIPQHSVQSHTIVLLTSQYTNSLQTSRVPCTPVHSQLLNTLFDLHQEQNNCSLNLD